MWDRLKKYFEKKFEHKCHYKFKCDIVRFGRCSCGARFDMTKDDLSAALARGEKFTIKNDCQICSWGLLKNDY